MRVVLLKIVLEPDSGFGRGNANRKDYEHYSGKRQRMGAVTPEGNEVEVCRVEHQLDADEHDDGVAPRQSARQADGEEQRRDEQIAEQRSHSFSFSRMAMITAPISAAVSSRPMTSSGKMNLFINWPPISRTVILGGG